MPVDRPIVPVGAIAPAAATPEPDAERGGNRLRNSIELGPLEWDVAVRAAGMLLDEMFGPPGSTDNPIMTDMARELAARLCAYDEITEAVEHMGTALPLPVEK
jgi:hypothetical protein